ncbi:hypothetical protein UP10_26350 [Bradyrhizobium sp. LTSPM299]|uniref:hypothetical protein n=1 Tax=Bradyrhizobium sp. LTSPM299 TaxID=1619233 RepID=UPI0005C82CA0|nr:hypothetical protein [Bradyrhizobium sp. LTSPM299]KJC57738.1 hypothetical protein UP10_26350 [Bradyrhizobium sp. LTSPM299]
MKRAPAGFIAPTCIEAFPLVVDLATKSEILVKFEEAAPAVEAKGRRERFAARANAILALAECPEKQRPKLREAIVEATLWARKRP